MSEARLFPQYFAGVSAAMGSFALGAVIGWCSPAELGIKAGQLGFKVSDTEFAWVGSLMTLGAAAVCIPIGIIIDIVGRKWTMLGLVPFFIIGWLLIIFASNTTMLYVARFLLGMCGGAFSIIAPIYTTEIAQIHIRGILGSLFQMLITIGILYGYIVGSMTPVIVASILCALVPVVMGLLVTLLPESPTFFIKKGKKENAEKSLRWLRGDAYDISGEISQLEANEKYAQENKVSLSTFMEKKKNRKALSYSLALMAFQQLSGINAIVFYCTALFKNANPNFSETLSTILVGTVMMLMTFIALFFIDRAGRRILLMLASGIMTISLIGVGIYFLIKDSNPASAAPLAMLPVICACLYVMAFSMGMGAIPWLMIGELFSEDVKGVAGSISCTVNWLLAFLVTNLYPQVSVVIGVGQTFCIFAAISFLALLFVIFILPETKNRTLLEIQLILEK